MLNMIGTKFNKAKLKETKDYTDYSKAAKWCNENNARIVEREDCYEVVSSLTDEEYAKIIRIKRDNLISKTDYLMTLDYPITDEQREELSKYRQALRDITSQSGFPRNVEFPEKPSFLIK